MWQYPFHIDVDDTTTILVYLAFYQDARKVGVERMGHAFISFEKEKSKNFKAYLCARDESRHQPDNRRWETGGSDHTNKFNFCTRREGFFTPKQSSGGERNRSEGGNPETPPISWGQREHLLSPDIRTSRHPRPTLKRRKVKCHPAMRISPTALLERCWALCKRNGLGINFQLR